MAPALWKLPGSLKEGAWERTSYGVRCAMTTNIPPPPGCFEVSGRARRTPCSDLLLNCNCRHCRRRSALKSSVITAAKEPNDQGPRRPDS